MHCLSEMNGSKHNITIESFGVKIAVSSNRKHVFDLIKKSLDLALARLYSFSGRKDANHVFVLNVDSRGRLDIFQNSELKYANLDVSAGIDRFTASLRLTVAEFAVGKAFIHAGAVGWKGKGIIIPARSFRGKSSLTAALVRCGARYYSDEYAILDKRGLLHPFPKDISLRGAEDDFSQLDHSVALLGGRAGKKPLPVKLVVLTEFKNRARWSPKEIGSGKAVLEILDNSVSIRRNPELVLQAVGQVATNCVAVKSQRGEAEVTAPLILKLLDQIE